MHNMCTDCYNMLTRTWKVRIFAYFCAMRHDKLESQLETLLLLTGNPMTVDDLCRQLGQKRRNIYYYLEFFRDSRLFRVTKHDRGSARYSIDPQSPFFRKLMSKMGFSETQNARMQLMMAQVEKRFADQEKLDVMKKAISQKRMVKIEGYSSSHSKTLTDRIVEPFMILTDGAEVRCYELASGMNKTFRLSRMENVIMLDVEWTNGESHREVYTDMFLYSAEERYPIRLRIGRIAYNSLVEQYPSAVRLLREDGDDRWILETEVCSYVAPTRFILSCLDDVEIIESDALRAYINNYIDRNSRRLRQNK